MPAISTVTYAGVSMSQKMIQDANYDLYIWTLPNGTQPTTGTNNFIVILASAMPSGVISCGGISFTGVDQTTTWSMSSCPGAGTGASGTSATASCTAGASGASDMVVVAECNGTSIGSPTGAINRRGFTDNAGGACESFGIGTAAGNTTAISWNNNGNDSWHILAGAIKASAGGATASRTPAHGDTL